MTQVTCPTCEKQFDLEKTSSPPFCSERCRLIDLGRWANEEFGMPIEREEEWGDGDGFQN